MYRVAGEKHAIFAVLVGEQQILPPRRARQHFVFDRNSDRALERGLHRFVAIEHRMQRPMPGGILHDQERRLVIGNVIMPAAARPIADRQTFEQFVAAKQRLAQLQQIAFAGKGNAELLAHRTGTAVATDEVGRANFFYFSPGAAQARGDALAVLPQAEKFPTEPHPHARNGLGNRLQQRLERVLRDQLIGLERQHAVVIGAGLRARLLNRRIRKVQ